MPSAKNVENYPQLMIINSASSDSCVSKAQFLWIDKCNLVLDFYSSWTLRCSLHERSACANVSKIDIFGLEYFLVALTYCTSTTTGQGVSRTTYRQLQSEIPPNVPTLYLLPVNETYSLILFLQYPFQIGDSVARNQAAATRHLNQQRNGLWVGGYPQFFALLTSYGKRKRFCICSNGSFPADWTFSVFLSVNCSLARSGQCLGMIKPCWLTAKSSSLQYLLGYYFHDYL